MAYLLRFLISLMVFSVTLTALTAMGFIASPYNHIQLAIPSFLLVIFVQAFVMFFFIGISRLVNNIHYAIQHQTNLEELFLVPPQDFAPYLKKLQQFVHTSTMGKRQTIPWTMLMLVLGMLAFLLGGAHDTGLVSKVVHAGVAYGFMASMFIGFFRQWHYLGKGHRLLRELKTLFSLDHHAM